ncbi:MAG: hypothetical protein AAGA48_28065 [Myxococcota bacterium]
MTELSIDKLWDGTPLPTDECASLRLAWEGDELVIDVDAPFQGDPAPTAPIGPTDRLWEHEVVELFVVGEGETYTEIELSPHGHHWVLRLEGIRQAVDKGITIEFAPTIQGDRWTGRARIAKRHLPADRRTANAFRIAGVGPKRRFFAWAPVPGDGPNFHRLEHFGAWPLG